MLSALFLVWTGPIQAEEGGRRALPDRFMIRGGYLYVFGADTNVIANGPAGFGANINFNRTLGGETTYNGFRADAAFRFNERHSLGFSYYRVLRNANRTISDDLTVENITVAAGAYVTSSLNFDLWRLFYNYSFYRNEKVELGLSPSVYMARMRFNVAGTASCSGTLPSCTGQPVVAGFASEQLTVPLPSLGGYLNYHITPKLMSQVRLDWFYLAVGENFTGGMLEFYAGLEYRLVKHFGLVASYDRLQANVDLNKANSDSGFSLNNSWNMFFMYGALYF